MSLLDRQNRLQKFLDDMHLSSGAIKFYNVLYSVIDFEEQQSEHKDFNVSNVLVKRSHSYPYSMQQLALATHKEIPTYSFGKTIDTAVASVKRKFVTGLTTRIRWGLVSAQWDKNRFQEYTSGIDKFRLEGELPDYDDLNHRPFQEVNYVIPAYSGKTLYVSGILRSNGTYLNWNKDEVHDTGIYIGTSYKSLDAAIGDRENKVAYYVAAKLTAA